MKGFCASLGEFMRFCLAVFRSRNETLYLANMLNSAGLRVSIINTPKDAGFACGISIKFDERYLNTIQRFIASKPFRSFGGFYRVVQNGAHNSYERIN